MVATSLSPEPADGAAITAAKLAAALDARGLLAAASLADPDRRIRTVQVLAPVDDTPMLAAAAVVAVGAITSTLIAELTTRATAVDAVLVASTPEIDASHGESPTSSDVCWLAIADGADWLDVITVVRDVVAGAAELSDEASNDLFGVADATAALLGAPVTIEDESGILLGYSRDQEGGDSTRVATIVARRSPAEFTAALASRGVLRRLAAATGPISVRAVIPGAVDRIALPLRSAGVRLGTMWVLVRDVPDDAQAGFLSLGKQAERLLFQRHADADRSRRIELEQLATLLHGGAALSAGTAERQPPAGVHRVAAIEVVPADPGARAIVRSRLEQRLSRPDGPDGLSVRGGQLSDLHYLILTAPVNRGPTSAAIAEWLRSLLTDHATGQVLDVHVGIGRPVDDARALPRSRREAEQALNVDRQAGSLRRSWNLEACWARAVLLRVLDAGAQAELDTLSPLRQLRRHDTEHNTAFVTTLRTWLRAHGNYRQAAGALHIHANTLRYRMQRLTELTSLDLADPDVRLVLELQLHLEGV